MFNTLKNTFLLSIITCVIAGLLLGLSFAANSASVTYYTFVMYQPQGGNWQLPKSSELTAGSYRFQIVRIPGDALLEWIALRGEFEFEADPAGGVKIKKQQALDEYAPIDNNSTLNYSLWETGERLQVLLIPISCVFLLKKESMNNGKRSKTKFIIYTDFTI